MRLLQPYEFKSLDNDSYLNLVALDTITNLSVNVCSFKYLYFQRETIYHFETKATTNRFAVSTIEIGMWVGGG